MKQILTGLLACAAVAVMPNGYAQTPKLNSYPEAAPAIYLNFDGEMVSGTSWNWAGPITAQPAGLSAEAITQIFNRVAEDYRPFAINVTTDAAVYAAAPFNQRIHVIITPTSGWYGSSGGVSFVGSFTWGDDTPAWVFSALLYNNPKNVAEACSHEAGHTLGLQHQSSYDAGCLKTEEYNSGQGAGEIGWAPIMGVGYSKNLTTWHTGANSAGCNQIQNDMEVITSVGNGISYKPDDYGNSPSSAEDLPIAGGSLAARGLINRMTDVDVFRLRLDHSSHLHLNAVPASVGSGNQGANIDIKVFVLDAASDTLASYNPSTLLDAGIDTLLQPGDYFLAVRGTGNINHSNYGSLGAYQLTGNLLTLLPVQQFWLTGNTGGGYNNLYWTYTADEPVSAILLESSADGKEFHPMLNTNTDQRSYAFSSEGAPAYYRLKATTAATKTAYYSNIIHLISGNEKTGIRLLSTLVTGQILFTATARYNYELFDAGGKLVAKGTADPGLNRISLLQAAPGIMILRYSDGASLRVQKLIKR